MENVKPGARSTSTREILLGLLKCHRKVSHENRAASAIAEESGPLE